MRLLDEEEFIDLLNEETKDANGIFTADHFLHLQNVIENTTTIDPEELPIVKQLREKLARYEQSGKWISVKDAMPEEHDSMFKRYYGTLLWDNNMFLKTSGEILVTVKDKNGKRIVRTSSTHDGAWKITDIFRDDITHWMPFPEPPEKDKRCEKLVI